MFVVVYRVPFWSVWRAACDLSIRTFHTNFVLQAQVLDESRASSSRQVDSVVRENTFVNVTIHVPKILVVVNKFAGFDDAQFFQSLVD